MNNFLMAFALYLHISNMAVTVYDNLLLANLALLVMKPRELTPFENLFFFFFFFLSPPPRVEGGCIFIPVCLFVSLVFVCLFVC